MSPDDVYTIGVSGDVLMPPIPPFAIQPLCEGLSEYEAQYYAQQTDGSQLPSDVMFYPRERQFRFNTYDFRNEGFLAMHMIGAIDYFIVPSECPLEEVIVERRVKRESVKSQKSGSNKSCKSGSCKEERRRRRLDHSGSGSTDNNDPCNLGLSAECTKKSCKSGSDKKRRLYRRLGSGSNKSGSNKSDKYEYITEVVGCPPRLTICLSFAMN